MRRIASLSFIPAIVTAALVGRNAPRGFGRFGESRRRIDCNRWLGASTQAISRRSARLFEFVASWYGIEVSEAKEGSVSWSERTNPSSIFLPKEVNNASLPVLVQGN